MAEELKLEILIGGTDVLGVIDRAADKVGELADVYGALTSAMSRASRSTESASAAVNKQSEALKMAVGPWQRLAQAQKDFTNASREGDANQRKDAALRLKRAEEAVKKAAAYLNPVQTVSTVSGPNSRYSAASGALQDARARGAAPSEIADAVHNAYQAFRAAQKAEPSGGVGGPSKNPLMDMIDTSRLSLRIGKFEAMPLVNRLKTLGGGFGGGGGGASFDVGQGAVPNPGGPLAKFGGAGPLIGALIALKLAVEGLKFAWDTANKAREYYSGYGSAQFGSGSGGGFSNVAGLGMAMGKSPGQISAEARSFGKGLWGDPFAMAYASQMGINPLAGPFGDVNYGKKLSTAYSNLSSSKYTDDQALRIGDAMGIDVAQLGLLRNASAGVRNRALSNMVPASKEDITRASDAQINYNLAVGQTEQIMVRLGNFALPALNGILSAVATSFELFARVLYGIDEALHLSFVGKLVGGVAGLGGVDLNGSGRARDAATDANTAATNELTGAISDLTGMVGFGSGNAGRALPAGAASLRNIEQYYKGQTAALGAITL